MEIVFVRRTSYKKAENAFVRAPILFSKATATHIFQKINVDTMR